MMMQMSNLMNGGGAGGPGAFPAPGVPGATATQGGGAPSPGAAPFFNPWVPTSSTSPGGTPAAGTGAAAGAAAGAPPNPFASMFDPAMMQQMMGAMGGGGFGGGLGGGLGGFGATAAPADTRPPEERFQVQLQV